MTAFWFPPTLGASVRRAAAAFTMACAGLTLAGPAAAQAVYQYAGHPFTLFSCGPSSSGNGTANCSIPAPSNTYTTYTATDRVTATLTLTSPLPASMALTDVRSLPGFQLSMSDGRHTVTNAIQAGMAAEVATDASGAIVNWRLIINTGGLDNGGIATQKATFISDSGTLRCCDPTVSGDFARNNNLPGTWTSGTPSPTAALANLQALVMSPELALSPGLAASLGDKLVNVSASIQAGLNKQAVNQLRAFVNQIESAAKNGKMSTSAAATLSAAANALIAMLQ